MMTRSKAMLCGFFAGVVAGIAMTFAMLLLAWAFDIATPLVILGDRLSVFISPKPFFWIMGRVGGYNHLKQLGVISSGLGQVAVGAIGGLVYGLAIRGRSHRRLWPTLLVLAVLQLLASATLVLPVPGTPSAGLAF